MRHNRVVFLTTSRPATGRVFFAFEPNLYNVCGTTYAWRYCQGLGRTILSTGTALHATVQIHNLDFSSVHGQYAMRTHHGASATADALLVIQHQRDHIFKVAEGFHYYLLRCACICYSKSKSHSKGTLTMDSFYSPWASDLIFAPVDPQSFKKQPPPTTRPPSAQPLLEVVWPCASPFQLPMAK